MICEGFICHDFSILSILVHFVDCSAEIFDLIYKRLKEHIDDDILLLVNVYIPNSLFECGNISIIALFHYGDYIELFTQFLSVDVRSALFLDTVLSSVIYLLCFSLKGM